VIEFNSMSNVFQFTGVGRKIVQW